jgi:TonB family protein
MKVQMTLLILIIFLIPAVAQKVERYYDWNWRPAESNTARFIAITNKQDSLWHRQDYFLQERRLQMDGFYRDEDTKTEQGLFRYYHANGQLESTGSYTNGKRQGVWLRYHSSGMMRDSVTYNNGNVVGVRLGWHPNGIPSDSSFFYPDGSGLSINWFDNGTPAAAGRYSAGGKLNGKWQYFHRNGQLSALEVYQEGTLLSKQYFDESGAAISDTTTKEQEAEFPGGNAAWQKYLYKRLFFPERYKLANADQAVVVVQWVIDESGTVTDVEVIAPFHPDFDKIAVEAIRKSPKWIPAISHNRTVKAYRRQPVTFQQN